MQGGKILSAIIVDDEVNAISNLKNLITAYCPTINVMLPLKLHQLNTFDHLSSQVT
jgi:hypothetical protein